MKYIFRLFIVFIAISSSLFSDIPHLVLYFDINKTLIASDKATNKSVEIVLNELLAEKYEYRWDESLPKPMTFNAYVNEILVPGSKDDQELQDLRSFYVQHFVDYLRDHKHSLYNEVLEDYEKAFKVLNTSNNIVFASFYSLLDDLDRKGISYSIILRSFGEEVFEVKTEINAIYKMIFNRMGEFHDGKLFLEENEPLNDPRVIYNQLRRIEHTAIQDDWKYWNAHKKSARQSKPFYIDSQDADTLSIFLDDKINEHESTKNIIGPLDVSTGQAVPIEDLVESGQAVRVDTLEAILDTHYYINQIEKALQKHALKQKKSKE